MTIFIPKKLKVGYQSRSDTFTGKLAYINYENDKKVWALDKSWKSWIKERQVDFLDNEPVSGFIINRSKTRYASFAGKSVNIRIYHPNGFEFEITPDNLCSVISHSDISRSYISQECILGWEGGRVLLIPTNSDIYQTALQATNNKLAKFEDNFIFAQTYIAKKQTQDNLIYLGKEKSFNPDIETWDGTEKHIQIITNKERNGHLFYNTIEKAYEYKTHSQIAGLSSYVEAEEAQSLLLNFKENPLYKDIYSLPTPSFKQNNETLKRMFLYTLLQRIINYSSYALKLSEIEQAQVQQVLDNACSKNIVLKNDYNFGLKIMKYETIFYNSKYRFDYAIALYTTDPVNIFNYNAVNTSIMHYSSHKDYCEFLLEYNLEKKELMFNNGYSQNFNIRHHNLSQISDFVGRFFKFKNDNYLHLATNGEIITNVKELTEHLITALDFIENKFNHFDNDNSLVTRLVDMTSFDSTFEAMRNYLKTKHG